MTNRKRGPRLITKEQVATVDAGTYRNHRDLEKGLQVGGIDHIDPALFHDHPDNEAYFNTFKTPGYWRELKKDISEAGQILEPILVTLDDVIISGHSRRKIALELLAEGREEFAKIPVRQILVPMDKEEIKRRVLLANLSRFEIDADTRLVLYAEVYPSYYKSGERGRHGDAPTVKEISDETGQSRRTVQRSRADYQNAEEIARTEGREKPVVKDIAEARATKNKKRRDKTQARGVTVAPPKQSQDASLNDTGAQEVTFLDSDTSKRVEVAGNAVQIDGAIALEFRDLTALTDASAFKAAVNALIQQYLGGDL